jgi:molybdopterin molybdotransferase
VLTPPSLGLACAVGHDVLLVQPLPTVAALVLGDELLTTGVPRDGLIRDSLGPQLPLWAAASGGSWVGSDRISDLLGATVTALEASTADVVVTTGGTARGPVDHLHAALTELDAELVVDGVALRPGRPMLLARLPRGTWVVGLPGNPLSAVVGASLLLRPLLAALAGRLAPPAVEAVLGGPTPRAADITCARAVALADGVATPTGYAGSSMLRGLLLADALAILAPGDGPATGPVPLLPLPWSPA